MVRVEGPRGGELRRLVVGESPAAGEEAHALGRLDREARAPEGARLARPGAAKTPPSRERAQKKPSALFE